MRRRGSKGFGFAIDYAKAIAYDEARIAALTDPAFVVLCANTSPELARRVRIDGPVLGRVHFATHDVVASDDWRPYPLDEVKRRAALLGLTLDELADLDLACTPFDFVTLDEKRSHLEDHCGPNKWRRGEELCRRFEKAEPLTDDATRRDMLRKAKADLARHKRNAAKYGKP